MSRANLYTDVMYLFFLTLFVLWTFSFIINYNQPNIDKFFISVERADYVDKLNAERPKNLCNVTESFVDNITCLKCIDNSKSVLEGWTKEGEEVCVN
jgi:hypothetical protein